MSRRVSGERQLRSRKARARSASRRGRRDRGETRPSTAQPREADQQRDVAGERQDVLHQLEGLGDHRERPGRGLAPRAGEPVVELGVLEVAQLERERLLEDATLMSSPAARRAAGGPARAREARAPGARRRQLDQHPAQGRAPSSGHDRVDDALARVGHPERHHRGHQGQRRRARASGAARPPTPGPGWPGCAGSSRAGRRAGIV